MKSEFSRVITLLRKEKNISQKQAAAELGISQALLALALPAAAGVWGSPRRCSPIMKTASGNAAWASW